MAESVDSMPGIVWGDLSSWEGRWVRSHAASLNYSPTWSILMGESNGVEASDDGLSAVKSATKSIDGLIPHRCDALCSSIGLNIDMSRAPRPMMV